MEERVAKLEAQIAALTEKLTAKGRQQLSYPLDDASRNIIGGVQDDGAGSTTQTQTIALSGNAENINVPAAYVGTRLVLVGGVRYEFPYISTS